MLVVILIAAVSILWSWSRRHRKNEPPLCSGGVMLLGHALLYAGNTAMVTNPDDCLTISNACLTKDAIYKFAEPWLGNGLVTSDASHWKVQRKLLNPAFSPHVLDSFIDIFNKTSRNFVKNLKVEVGKGPFDHWEYTKQNSFETVCLTTLGVDFYGTTEANNDFILALSKIMNAIITRFQSFWLHNDFLFSLSSLKAKQDECIKVLHRTSNAILKQKKEHFLNSLSDRKNEENTTKATKFKPFMELLLELAHDTNIFTDREIREHVDTMVVAGHDTFSAVLMYFMLSVASHPRVQEKIYEELKNVFGDEDRDVTKQDLQRLVYLEAAIKESMRFYPTAPVIGRHLDKDVKLPDYTLYKGNSVFLSIYGINRHHMWGPDVEEFKPERWLDPSTLPNCPISVAGFGIGRRNCIGKSYSMMSMKVTFAHIFRNYILHTDHPQLELKLDVILKPISGIHITIENRK